MRAGERKAGRANVAGHDWWRWRCFHKTPTRDASPPRAYSPLRPRDDLGMLHLLHSSPQGIIHPTPPEMHARTLLTASVAALTRRRLTLWGTGMSEAFLLCRLQSSCTSCTWSRQMCVESKEVFPARRSSQQGSWAQNHRHVELLLQTSATSLDGPVFEVVTCAVRFALPQRLVLKVSSLKLHILQV